MNKTASIIGMALVLMLSLSACDKDAHKDENDLKVNLTMPNDDAVSGIRLWVYQSDGLLVDEYHYAGNKELALAALPLDAGDYVLIAATNLVAPFAADQGIADGVKPYEALVFSLDDASASPAHAHYGVRTVTVSPDASTRTEVKMNRILAEMQFTIKGMPAEVTRVDARITNVAKRFLPYSSRLLPETDIASLGSAAPQNGIASLPVKRLMPVTDVLSRAGGVESAVATRLAFTFHYADGSTMEVTATAPAIENGGSYTPEVVYDIFRPGIEITISTINGWKEGENTEGEILNPTE